eukprot:TRINITY_DN94392_c0_g1_i1.p1 TRINITY_DN94392_c0_g1~~TRINITY_DN94392_c0_g1_i1.p1  ORF type:complete len:349 (+),score=173.42 TRINITY_DN94392_c0_g1_i1:56-1102(+)
MMFRSRSVLVCLVVAVVAMSAVLAHGVDVPKEKTPGIGSPVFQELKAKTNRRGKKWIAPLAVGMGLGHLFANAKGAAGGLVGQAGAAAKGAAQTANSLGQVLKVAKAAAAGKLTTPAFMISQADQQCVICQYLTERVRGEMLVQGIGGGVPFAARPDVDGMNQAGIPGQFTPPPSMESGEGAAAADAGATETSLLQVLDGLSPLAPVPPAPGLMDKAKATVDAIKAHTAEPEQLPSQRDRTNEMLRYRPTQTRFANLYDGPEVAMKRAKDRFENNQMYSLVYHGIESVCTKSVPKPFYTYCGAVLQNYKDVAQGLRNKDRPDAICMRMDFCSKDSYVQRGPHAVYRQA